MQIDFLKFSQISHFQSKLTCDDPLFFLQWKRLLKELYNYHLSENTEFSLKAFLHYELYQDELDLGLYELLNEQYMHVQHDNTHLLLTSLNDTQIYLLPWKVKDVNNDIYYFGEDKIVCPNGKILEMCW